LGHSGEKVVIELFVLAEDQRQAGEQRPQIARLDLAVGLRGGGVLVQGVAAGDGQFGLAF
jgi:hypothetical protein